MAFPRPGNFCVYTTVDVDMNTLVKTLNEGQYGNHPCEIQWAASPKSFTDQPISAIINYHRTSPGIFNKLFFVVADRMDWATAYVLAVNLDYEGFIDAARIKASVAGDAIPSCNIMNTDWYELTGRMTGSMYPKGAFAVYASTAITGKMERKLLEELSAGLESRKDNSVEVCRLGPSHIPVTKEIETADGDIDLLPLAKEHLKVAQHEKLDSAMFIVADETDWDEYGVLIARVTEDGAKVDSCRKPIDVAAEILTWVHQGLYTWEEGRLWDEEKHVIDEDQ